MLEVIEPGLHSTIQDAGRPGAGHLGVRHAGAADRLAAVVASLLVGEAPGSPVVEMTLLGGSFRVVRDCLIGLAGADMGGHVPGEGRPLRPGGSYRLRAGATIVFSGAIDGARTYLALAGGIEAQVVLGSASTDPVAGYGGIEGRPLRAGDLLRPAVRSDDRRERMWPAGVRASGVVAGEGVRAISIVAGPHLALLGPVVAEALTDGRWTVTPRSDRVGLRLEGEPAPGAAAVDLVSLPMLPGAVQLPPAGQPILLMPDAPTVGGYPVPAVVAEVDRPVCGQLRPGDLVRFKWIDLELARQRAAAFEAGIRTAAMGLA